MPLQREIDKPLFIRRVFEALYHRAPNKTRGDQAKTWVSTLCPNPAHDDQNPSFSYNVRTGENVCHGPCDTGFNDKQLAEWLGIEIPYKEPERRKVAEYAYHGEQGEHLYTVVRYQPKGFSQWRPGPNGEPIWNLNGTRRVPYQLPAVLQAIKRGDTVYICEGEKDCNLLAGLGLVATTNSGGACKFTAEHAKHFAGADCVILPDNDEPGRKHAAQVGELLEGAGASRVRVLELPNLPDKGDVSDWLPAKGSVRDLLALAAEAPDFTTWAASREAKPSPEATNEPDALDEYARSPRLPERNTTDMGNGERLIDRFGHLLHYVPDMGGWYLWDGQRWKRDKAGQVRALAKNTARSIYAEASAIKGDDEASKARRQALAAHAARSEAASRIEAMLALAWSEPGIPLTPDQLDTDPWKLNCRNGVLWLGTDQLEPHDPGELITKLADVEYDPAAEAPTWLRFLHEVMAGDQARIDFLQRAVGYSLTGDTSEQVFFICYGTGANGKSTFLETIQTLAGEYALSTPMATFMEKRDQAMTNDIAALRGARLVTAAEVRAGSRLHESLVKQVTGGDTISARFLHHEFFQFKPQFKLWLAVNHKPTITNTDLAIWRRVMLVPFTVTFPEAAQDKNLPAKLRGELPGILAWAAEGARKWAAEGLGAPPAVRAATQAYRAEMDVIGEFLLDQCIEGPTYRAASSELYQAYVAWCTQSGEEPLKQRTFSRRLIERGFEQGRTETARYFLGIGLRLTH